MIVDPSEKSKQDVLEIARYIAEENVSAALRFLDAVDQTYDVIGEFPNIGHPPVFDFVEDLQTVLIRGFEHYQVFYRVLDDRVRIDRVADGRRHLPKLFDYLKNIG